MIIPAAINSRGAMQPDEYVNEVAVVIKEFEFITSTCTPAYHEVSLRVSIGNPLVSWWRVLYKYMKIWLLYDGDV